MKARFPRIIEALVSKPRTQDQVARELDLAPANVKQYLDGQTIPKVPKLASWAPYVERTTGITFEEMFHAQSHDRLLRDLEAQTEAERVAGKDAEMAGRMREVLKSYESYIAQIARTAHRHERLPKVLSNFPAAFLPLTIVVGDTREDPAKTIGDLAAYPASPCDDRYLCDLGLPRGTEKVSDKVFVQADRDYLEKRFGQRNLLVLGSPAGNHLARLINKDALFRFNLDARSVGDLDAILTQARAGASDSFRLQEIRRDQESTLKFAMRRMFAGGLFDPTYKHFFRGSAISDAKDFGVISLARHPYATGPEYVCILVAGLHLPGTMHSLRMLAQCEQFRAHPYGGIVDISIPVGLAWERKLERCKAEWDRKTDPDDEYEAICQGLKEFKQGESPSRSELDDTLKFVEALHEHNRAIEAGGTELLNAAEED